MGGRLAQSHRDFSLFAFLPISRMIAHVVMAAQNFDQA